MNIGELLKATMHPDYGVKVEFDPAKIAEGNTVSVRLRTPKDTVGKTIRIDDIKKPQYLGFGKESLLAILITNDDTGALAISEELNIDSFPAEVVEQVIPISVKPITTAEKKVAAPVEEKI